ncbi:hypothetical protein L1887_32126 [Cichorium endivia]|nr:hypothetical protein L1887_32126 [Cichorium endivia]
MGNDGGTYGRHNQEGYDKGMDGSVLFCSAARMEFRISIAPAWAMIARVRRRVMERSCGDHSRLVEFMGSVIRIFWVSDPCSRWSFVSAWFQLGP